jgi:antitoxin (DNA-binding transcriptional repressor) of toxin-antitoxin stability system
MLLKRINVKKGERVIVTKNGRFAAILTPGSHLLFVPPMVSLGIESYYLQSSVLGSRWTRYFIQNRPDIISAHFTLIQTSY